MHLLIKHFRWQIFNIASFIISTTTISEFIFSHLLNKIKCGNKWRNSNILDFISFKYSRQRMHSRIMYFNFDYERFIGVRFPLCIEHWSWHYYTVRRAINFILKNDINAINLCTSSLWMYHTPGVKTWEERLEFSRIRWWFFLNCQKKRGNQIICIFHLAPMIRGVGINIMSQCDQRSTKGINHLVCNLCNFKKGKRSRWKMCLYLSPCLQKNRMRNSPQRQQNIIIL